jgi:DNA-binding HxlR family transcriptional regulator
VHDDCPSFAPDCRVRLVTDLLAHTWDPVVLMALRAGRRRRIDLLAGIGGISDEVLSEALRRLLASGLITRVAPTSGRTVVYELSDLGDSLANGPMTALGRWAIDHGDQVLTAQQRHSEPSARSTSARR